VGKEYFSRISGCSEIKQKQKGPFNELAKESTNGEGERGRVKKKGKKGSTCPDPSRVKR